MKKESHIDRNQKAFPLAVSQLKIRKPKPASGHTTILSVRLSAEKNRAGRADTDHLARRRLNQVLVIRRQLGATQLTAFDGGSLSHEPFQNIKRLTVRHKIRSHKKARKHKMAL
jgi:hypothetical protein